MAGILIFGLGYMASRLAERLCRGGWAVLGTRRTASAGAIAFEDEEAVRVALAGATHVLSSVPPGERDPVLDRYGSLLTDKHWLGYLSSTGVYGDTGGAWVDESAPIGTGRRSARTEADAAWLARGARVFRLPGIYGPGRSALERVAEGRAHRIDLPGQVFSRIHVDDIVTAAMAGFDAPPGAYNIADDAPCSQNRIIEEACRLLGLPPPPIQSLDEAGLSPAARAFYAENRRVANGKARRVLGWRPAYPDYRAGLAACLACNATISPAMASRQPTPASADQR
ncbi:MAG TPA: SDR family NAD(P)-dependent oxidoreductase [Sphingomonas sp.]